jgi:hypothetical protein
MRLYFAFPDEEQEGCALTQGHLLRAVQLEYRELGKLSTSGRMD